MTIEGTLDVFQLPEILQVVAQQQKTGILTVQGDEDIVAISFLEGAVVGADSLNQTGEESLSAVLRRERMVEPEALERARAEQESSGNRLQDVLVEGGYMERPRLLEALRLQYEGLLSDLLRWKDGEFKFYSNDEVAYEEGLKPILVQDVLLRSIEEESSGPPPARPRAGPRPSGAQPVARSQKPSAPPSGPAASAPTESRPAPSGPPPTAPPRPGEPPSKLGAALESPDRPELRVVYQRLPSSRPIKVRSKGTEGVSDDAGFLVVSPAEQKVLGAVDGQRNAGELLRATGLDAAPLRAALERLMELRLLRPVGDAGEVPGLAEVETFPAEDPAEIEQREEADRQAARVEERTLLSWAARILGLVAAALLALAVVRGERSVLLPYPWQEAPRHAVEEVQRKTAFLKIDRAAKTYFLTFGRFPDDLRALTDLHLLSSSDLEDPEGRPLSYIPGDLQYEVVPLRAGSPLVEQGATEAITGNFLLDLDFFSIIAGPEDRPLVLLD